MVGLKEHEYSSHRLTWTEVGFPLVECGTQVLLHETRTFDIPSRQRYSSYCGRTNRYELNSVNGLALEGAVAMIDGYSRMPQLHFAVFPV